MSFPYRVADFIRWSAALVLFSMLIACAFGPRVVSHGFTFDVLADSPEAELLAYRYGDSDLPVSWMPGPNEKSQTPQRAGVYGPMRQGDSLYVKWRLKATGETHEDTVDLRHRLPQDIAEHEIYFMIKGPQLYVYLIPPESKKRPAGTPPSGPRKYRDLAVRTIYPDPPKN